MTLCSDCNCEVKNSKTNFSFNKNLYCIKKTNMKKLIPFEILCYITTFSFTYYYYNNKKNILNNYNI